MGVCALDLLCDTYPEPAASRMVHAPQTDTQAFPYTSAMACYEVPMCVLVDLVGDACQWHTARQIGGTVPELDDVHS